MLIAIHGVKLYDHCCAWSEALCPLLYLECSYMLVALHGMKLRAQCSTWSDA